MNKKLISLTAAAVATFSVLGLAGCGSSTNASDSKTIVVAATPTPHAEILNDVVKQELKKEGYTLEVKELTDYVQPNTLTEEGEVDANYFQHKPYLDDFNKEHGTHIASVAAVHFEPFGLYPGKTKDLKSLADGAVVAVPNDATNEARALLLLQDAGLIKLKDPRNIASTTKDITDNPKHLEFKELEAAVVPTVLQDVDIAALNGNYALQAKFNPSKDALFSEKSDGIAAQTYANIVAVKEGNEKSEKTQALVKAITSDAVRDYITKTYSGAVVAVF